MHAFHLFGRLGFAVLWTLKAARIRKDYLLTAAPMTAFLVASNVSLRLIGGLTGIAIFLAVAIAYISFSLHIGDRKRRQAMQDIIDENDVP